jgi:hypothetical protein
MMTKMTPFCPASRRTAGGRRGAWKGWPEVPKKLVLASKYFPSLTYGQRVRLYYRRPSGSLPVVTREALACPPVTAANP